MVAEAGLNRSVLNSKYALVIAVAKRAREIVDRKEDTMLSGEKPVTRALHEIEQGKVAVTLAKRDRGNKTAAEARENVEEGPPGESGPLV